MCIIIIMHVNFIIITGKGSSGWWCTESSVCGSVTGLGEVMPLRVIFHNASDGTILDTATTQQSSQSIFTINSDNSLVGIFLLYMHKN